MLNPKIILTTLFLLAFLLTACGETSPSVISGGVAAVTPTPAKRTEVSKTELDYPGAKWLSEKDIWPEGVPNTQHTLFGTFISNNSQSQILDFYHKKLQALGLGYEPNYSCLDPGSCRNIYLMDAGIIECAADHKACGETYQIQFLLVSASATKADDPNGNIPDTIYYLTKTGQTLVIFMGGPYHPFQPPSAHPTTAAVLTPSTTTPKP